jgi:hypothetical protein
MNVQWLCCLVSFLQCEGGSRGYRKPNHLLSPTLFGATEASRRVNQRSFPQSQSGPHLP